MFNKILSLLLIFSLAFNIAFAGMWVYHRRTARPPRPGLMPGPRFGGQPPQGLRRPPWAQLNLRAPQERKISEGWGEVRQKVEALNADVRKQRELLLDLLAADELDREAIVAREQQIEAVQEEVRQLVVEQMLKTRDALSPPQRMQWIRMMKTAGRRRGRGGRQGGSLQGPPSGPFGGPQPGARERRRGLRPSPPQQGEGASSTFHFQRRVRDDTQNPWNRCPGVCSSTGTVC